MPRLTLAVVAAFALAAAGCGSEAAPEGAVETKSVRTARIETTTQFEFAGHAQEFRSTQRVDYANDGSETVDATTGCRTIQIGDVSYAELPPDAGLPPGKRWVRIAPSAKTSEQVFEQSLEPKPADAGWTSYAGINILSELPTPTDYLDYLREVSGELRAVGEEVVDGVKTTRFRATIDVKERVRHDLEAEGWKAANVERYLELADATTEEIEVWADAEGRVRKTVTRSEGPGDDPGGITTTTEYLDFGVAVDIAPPPPAAVLDGDEWTPAELSDEEDASVSDGSEPAEPHSPPRCLH